MQLSKASRILVENTFIESRFLARKVKIDCYWPVSADKHSHPSLLLLNDGQHMQEMGFAPLLDHLIAAKAMDPVFCVGIHAGPDRKMEYGIAGQPDFKGRGAKAALYSSFILQELLPFVQKQYTISSFKEKAFAGFSLGGLTAFNMVWSHPDEFSKAGVFSGSLWWRSKDQSDLHYDDDKHRLIHQEVRKGGYHPGLRFFFQCGNMDETKDRNRNGVIDSIDDTLDLVKELEEKGYKKGKDIYYLEIRDGRHDIATWARALPVFLKWGWEKGAVSSR